MSRVVYEGTVTHLPPFYVNVLDFGSNSNKVDFLVRVQALADQLLRQSPHVIASNVLVLEMELYKICRMSSAVHLLKTEQNPDSARETHLLQHDVCPSTYAKRF